MYPAGWEFISEEEAEAEMHQGQCANLPKSSNAGVYCGHGAVRATWSAGE